MRTNVCPTNFGRCPNSAREPNTGCARGHYHVEVRADSDAILIIAADTRLRHRPFFRLCAIIRGVRLDNDSFERFRRELKNVADEASLDVQD